MKRVAVYPGSFDPIHDGHMDIALRAAKIFDEVIVAIYDMTKKSLLFSLDARLSLSERAFKGHQNIRVAPFTGLLVNYAQTEGAMALIRGLRVFSDFELEFRMGLANKKLNP